MTQTALIARLENIAKALGVDALQGFRDAALADLRELIKEAKEQEPAALPELPITPYRRGSDGAHLYDAMMMHQYALRYTALGEPK